MIRPTNKLFAKILTKQSTLLDILSVVFLALFFILMPTGLFFPIAPPLAEYIFTPYVTPGVFLCDLGLLAAVISLAFKKNQTSEKTPLPIYLFFPLALFIVLALVTAPSALSLPLALLTTLRWATAVVAFFVLWKSYAGPEMIAILLLASLSLEAVIAIGQAIFQSPLGLPGEMIVPPGQPGAAVIYFSGHAWLRVSGLTFHPNVLGGFFAIGLITSLPLIKHWPVRAAWWLLAAGLFFTFSRSAWLAALVTIPPVVWWLARQKPEMRRPLAITLGIATSFAAITGILLAGPLLTRLQPFASLSESTSIAGRGELIAIAMQIIGQSPLHGVGAGNFPLAMLPYPTMDPPHYVHNVPLLLASEIGLAGGLLWYWIWLFPIFQAAKFIKEHNPWPIVFSAAILAFGLIALWDSYPWALASGRYLMVVLLAGYAISAGKPAALPKSSE
jgi:hypothetical protein